MSRTRKVAVAALILAASVTGCSGSGAPGGEPSAHVVVAGPGEPLDHALAEAATPSVSSAQATPDPSPSSAPAQQALARGWVDVAGGPAPPAIGDAQLLTGAQIATLFDLVGYCGADGICTFNGQEVDAATVRSGRFYDTYAAVGWGGLNADGSTTRINATDLHYTKSPDEYASTNWNEHLALYTAILVTRAERDVPMSEYVLYHAPFGPEAVGAEGDPVRCHAETRIAYDTTCYVAAQGLTWTVETNLGTGWGAPDSLEQLVAALHAAFDV
jgi:hypothetical protein